VKKFLLSCFVVCITYTNELLFLNNLKETLSLDEQTYAMLALHAHNNATRFFTCCNHYVPLFAAYPSLKTNTPYIALGSFPTPLQRLTALEKSYNIHNLFIKQDSLSGGIKADGAQLFGGNKVRKLEFLLADALQYNAKSVLTFGCIGSNHAVATATYAQQCGLRCYCMLKPQMDSPVVQRNLALMRSAGAEIIVSPDSLMRKENTIKAFSDSKKTHGDYPYFIPTGGSTALGAVGFVNAAFELGAQIKQGLLPQPDYIYVAAGSFGTTAGLALGLKAARIQSRIIAVCVEPEDEAGSVVQHINILFKQTNELLHTHDQTFPLFDGLADNVTVIHGFGGTCYGVCTQEATDAMHDVHEYENIILDGTYTGKAFAALAAHAQAGMLSNKNVLFWNTFCGDGLKDED
jgi:1-aminocyclopropane-1-carboxylate deaminase/D-cysteine desulfhydrase-like pyridoxal-dependent ACC family enzyme